MHQNVIAMEEAQRNRVGFKSMGLSFFFLVTHRESVLVAGNLGTRADSVDGTPRTALSTGRLASSPSFR